MLKLRNINICYGNNEVITEGNIELNPGDLCLISGDSGTGKSSLLDILSLQNKGNHTYEYYWKNEDVLLFDEKKKCDFLFNDLACVAQNNLIFGEFTVNENLESFCEIGYGKVRKDLIIELVDKLGLKKHLDKKTKKLSGGEKQRVAIACAVLKNADLYLFDEPTSMIDIDRKEVVYQLLKDLASQGKIVMVVSHELAPSLFNKVYIIQNQRLLLEKSNNLNGDVSYQDRDKTIINLNNIMTKISNKFFFSQPFVNALYIIIISICMALMISIFGEAYSSINEQKELAEVVNNPELFVVNTETFIFTASDPFGAHPISDEDYEKMKDIEGVVDARRYVYFPLQDGIRENNDSDLPSPPSYDESMVTLKINDKEVTSFNYFNEFGYYYAIYPTYEHQNINEKCSSIIDEDGIYITQTIADLLGIKEVNGKQTLNLYFSVPISNAPGYFIQGETREISLRRYMYSILVNKDFLIKGIVSDTGYYSYMHMYGADFYLDINTIEAIQKEYYEKNLSLVNKLSVTEMPWPDFRKYYETRIVDPSIWKSSAVVVHVKENEDIDRVVSEISRLNPNISVAIKNYGMVDIDSGMTANVVKTALGYSIVILVVILLSIAIIKGFRRKTRKEDYNLLKQNGFDHLGIKKIEEKENHLEIVIISIVSIILTILSYFILTKLFYLNISISIWMIILLVCIVEGSIFGGDAISKVIVKNSGLKNKK